jgi:hypothetical protein
MDLKVGDTIEVPSNKVGTPPRRGLVEEIIEHDPLRIEVTWDDGHRSIFHPAAGNVQVVADSSA